MQIDALHKRDGVLDRSLAILSAFHGDLELTLTEITHRVDLPKSTVHRLTSVLSERGLLRWTGAGYRLGLRLFEVGNQRSDVHELIRAAQPYLRDLAESTRGAVNLSIPEGQDALYVSCLTRRGTPPCAANTGSRIPLHLTAAGKSILAFSDPAVIRAYLSKRLERRTPYTVVQPIRVLHSLDRIREERVCLEREELLIGLASVAAPVVMGTWLVGAISISESSTWFNRHNADLVQVAARRLGADLEFCSSSQGGHAWPWLRAIPVNTAMVLPGKVPPIVGDRRRGSAEARA